MSDGARCHYCWKVPCECAEVEPKVCATFQAATPERLSKGEVVASFEPSDGSFSYCQQRQDGSWTEISEERFNALRAVMKEDIV